MKLCFAPSSPSPCWLGGLQKKKTEKRTKGKRKRKNSKRRKNKKKEKKTKQKKKKESYY